MKIQVIPKTKTKDKKQDQVILSMTEREASCLLIDLSSYRKVTNCKESIASWSCIRNLKDYFDGKMELTTQD